ncbi:ankyrin-1 [Caerostris extrusa]|uniref:Alpha-latrotoxin n=1 Tax=Caerostris extrusa TaxID=172846 RepID=A0AAV4Q2M1_CAEEX|nr:ankyrin-1 [Caerostris extrusa]
MEQTFMQKIAGYKPIHVAAEMGFKDIVEFYLDRERSADVNAVSIFGSTPLHLAAGNDFKDIVGMLLHNGAYYNALDGFNLTPLQLSKENCISTLLRIVEELFSAVEKNDYFMLENEIKVGFNYSKYCFANAKCLKNETLLHFASKNGCEEIVVILLKQKINPNTRDPNKYTPLHYAAKSSHFNVVKSLLMNGAVYNALSHNQETALDIAVGKRNYQYVTFRK